MKCGVFLLSFDVYATIGQVFLIFVISSSLGIQKKVQTKNGVFGITLLRPERNNKVVLRLTNI